MKIENIVRLIMNKLINKIAIVMVSLSYLGMAQATNTVYVPVGSANEVLIIDADLDKVVGSIGDVTNVHGLASSPVGDLLVAGSMSLGPANQTIPEGMSEDEHNAHHTASKNQNTQPVNNTSYISIIDAKAKRVLKRIDVAGISHHSVVTPDGRYALSTHTTAGNVSIIDMTSKSLHSTIATGPVPNYVVVSSDGKMAYVSNSGNGTVSEIAIEQWSVRRNFKVGVAPEHMVFSKDEKTLYVINVGDNSVSAVSILDGKSINTYSVGNGPHGIDISDDGKRLFVSNKKGNGLTLIDIDSGTSRVKSLAPDPYHIKSIKGTGKLYISSRSQPWIWVVDQKSLEVISKIQIKGEGHQMALVNN
jgi:DNA-binding beta-propeller fold protein YncE